MKNYISAQVRQPAMFYEINLQERTLVVGQLLTQLNEKTLNANLLSDRHSIRHAISVDIYV